MKKLIFLCLLALTSLACAESKIVVRSRLDTKAPIYVGQQVRIRVEVLGNEGWANSKKVADIEVPGALMMHSETQGSRLQESIDGESYSGQNYELLIFPKRAGTITVPAIPLDVEVKQWGVGQTPQVERKQTAPITFEATYPPGTAHISELICSTRLQVKQLWKPEQTEQVMVGDSIKRVVTQKVAGMPGAALVPTRFAAIGGTTLYPSNPEVDRSAERGVLTGSRSDAATYVFTRAANVQLPDISVSWWDTNNNELKQELLPGRIFNVIPNPAILTPQEIQNKSSRKKGVLLAAALLTLTGIIFYRPLKQRWQHWCNTRKHAEQAFFKRFTKACKTNDPVQSLTALMQWLDRIDESSVSPQLNEFIARYGSEQAQNSAAQLTTAALNKTTWSGQPIATDMKSIRKQWISRQRKETAAKRILPELNP